MRAPVCDMPWLWVCCTDYLCGHGRAVALTPWVIRWNVDDPRELIRRNFRCVMCNRKGVRFLCPTTVNDLLIYAPFPADRAVQIGGRRLNPESCSACEIRCRAIYESRRHVWSRYWPS